jgi:hypothetical protein
VGKEDRSSILKAYSKVSIVFRFSNDVIFAYTKFCFTYIGYSWICCRQPRLRNIPTTQVLEI